MHQIYVWLVMTFCCVLLFISFFCGVSENFSKRNTKQTLNLVGNEIVNYVDKDKDNKIIIDDIGFVSSIKNILNDNNFCGCIFINKDNAYYVNKDMKKSNLILLQGDFETSVIDKINYLFNDLINDDMAITKIEIGSKESEMIHNCVFNRIEGVTVFLVMQTKKYYTVSGYSLL